MAADSIAVRYARALFDAAQANAQVRPVFDELQLIDQLLHEQPTLGEFLLNPDVEPSDKIALLDRAFHGNWSALLRAFLRMVISLDRAAWFAPIVEAYRALVDEAEGLLRVTVRSARKLPEPMLARLQQHLEIREHRQILLRTDVAPELLGGLQIVLGHRVIDSSVRRQLDDLEQQLKAVRVY